MKAKLHMKNTMDELCELEVLWLYNIKQIHSIKKFLKMYHKKLIFIKSLKVNTYIILPQSGPH